MPGGWLGRPAMSTIRLSAPRTGSVESISAPATANQAARRRNEEVVMGKS